MMFTLLKALPYPLYYLIGSFPSGYLIARYHGVDIAQVGSGNVGATNIARTMGKKSGIITLLLDICKGLLTVGIADFISNGSESARALAGCICVLGHCYSIPPYLKGGKGVATAFGVLISIQVALGLCVLFTFGFIFWAFRIVSLASVAAAVAASITALFVCVEPNSWYFVSVMTLVVISRHRENIERLIHGKEAKFSFSKKANADPVQE